MTQELTVVDSSPMTVFGTTEPNAILARVVEIAKPLGDFIKQQHMSTSISGREYVLAEGWSFMGAMLGVAPVTRRVSDVRDNEGRLVGFEAQVELVTRDGSVVGGAIAECSWVEDNWGDRAPFALKSMAQTRATGKAYRMALGFVMKAAGYEATPAEEMTGARSRETYGRGNGEWADDVPGAPAQTRDVTSDVLPEFKNVGQLLTWANKTYGMDKAKVCIGLGIANTDEITDLTEAANGIVAFNAPF